MINLPRNDADLKTDRSFCVGGTEIRVEQGTSVVLVARIGAIVRGSTGTGRAISVCVTNEEIEMSMVLFQSLDGLPGRPVIYSRA